MNRKKSLYGAPLWHFRLRIPNAMGSGIRRRLDGEGRSGFSHRQRAEPNRRGNGNEFQSVSRRFRPPGYDLSLEIQKWLKSLYETSGLAWTTIAKMRGLMHRIYKVGILHEHVAKNPVIHDSEIPTLSASLHAGAHLRGDCAPLVGDSRSALGGRALARGKDSNFKALGQGRRRRNKN